MHTAVILDVACGNFQQPAHNFIAVLNLPFTEPYVTSSELVRDVTATCNRHTVYTPSLVHAEGKNSLVNCLSNICSVRFKNWWHNVFKNVLCDVTQSLKLWKSSKETTCCRDHPSRSFRTPRNEDSQNTKPLSTSDSLETILSTFESLRKFSSSETHTARSQKSRHSFAGWFYKA